MADEDTQNTEGPKDTTPDPLEEARKEAEAAEKKAEEAPAEQAPAEEAPPPEPEEKGPENIKDAMKESFLDSLGWNRLFQIIFLAAGLFGIYAAISAEKFLGLPAALGNLAIALAVLFDVYVLKKFKAKAVNIEFIERYALAGLMGLFAIIFAVEIFKPFDISVNMDLLMIQAAALVAIISINFILYIRRNKTRVLSDIYAFTSFILAVLAAFAFVYRSIIPSFLLASIAIVLLLLSATKSPLKKDPEKNIDTASFRVPFFLVTILVSAGILLYAATIFSTPLLKPITYGTISPVNKSKPVNLSWSGDSWSFVYNVVKKKKKKKEGKVIILNALSMGTTELPPLPPKEKSDLTLPEYIDAGLWNKDGRHLIFTASDRAKGDKSIWQVNLTLSLAEKVKDGEKAPGEKKKKKEDKNANKPVGKPKVLWADINKAIDKKCKPLTHKTAWSPDGKKFVFAAKSSGKINNIYTADAKKQEMIRITRGANKMMPLWSPSGERILYVSKTDSYTYLKVSNYDGSNAHEFNLKKKADRDLFPLWNAAESKVIYLKDNERPTVMNANATNQKKLSRKSLPKSKYWLTEDKKKVRLNYTDSGNIWRVWTITPKGNKNKKIFEEVCEGITQPKWSYDGKSIVLGANYGKSSSLYRLDKNGKFKTRIYTTKHDITELEWAPTSKRIAFIVKKPKVEELWVVNNDGTKPLMLYETHKNAKINNMSWDDDGKRIAFDEKFRRLYFRPYLRTIRVVHAIGGEVKDLLPYEFESDTPTWSNDGQVLAYISGTRFWNPKGGIAIWFMSKKNKIWIAQLK